MKLYLELMSTSSLPHPLVGKLISVDYYTYQKFDCEMELIDGEMKL